MGLIKKGVFVIYLMLLTNCSQDLLEENLTFELLFDDSFQVVPDLSNDVTTKEYCVDIQTNFEVTLTGQNLTNQDIEAISLNEFKMEILDPQGESFNFLKSVFVYIETTDVPRLLIADRVNIAQNSINQLSLNLLDYDLKDYFLDQQVKLTFKLVTRNQPNNTCRVKFESVFEVDALIEEEGS